MNFTTPRTSVFLRHKSFSVEVLHFEDKGLSEHDRNENKWFVYAYIFDNHPRYSLLDKNGGMWQDEINILPFHAGCSFARLDTLEHCGSSKPSQVWKLGCDYNHYGDDYFLQCGIENIANSNFDVLRDAALLFENLENEFNDSIKD